MKKLLFLFVLAGLTTQLAIAQQRIKLYIDAGHGGSDPGAKAKSGEKESDLCLDMAYVLLDYAKQNGMDAVMIRTKKDQTMTHEARSGHKAEKTGKTYFVSLHLDHADNPNTKGGKIYYYSKSYYGSASRVIAERMAREVERLNKTKIEVTDKEAIILTKNDMPGMMVYYGFMTNKEDLKRAKDSEYQKELAMSIIKCLMQ